MITYYVSIWIIGAIYKVKKGVLEKFIIFTKKTPVLESLLEETPTQVLSYEYCEIFKSTYFKE